MKKIRVKSRSGWAPRDVVQSRKSLRNVRKDFGKSPLVCSLPCEGSYTAMEFPVKKLSGMTEYYEAFSQMLIHSYASFTQMRNFSRPGILTQASNGTHFVLPTTFYCVVSKKLNSVSLYSSYSSDSCGSPLASFPLRPYAPFPLSDQDTLSLYKVFTESFSGVVSQKGLCDDVYQNFHAVERSINSLYASAFGFDEVLQTSRELPELTAYLESTIQSTANAYEDRAQRSLFPDISNHGVGKVDASNRLNCQTDSR